MKLIKQLETHRNHVVAKTVTYKNVSFPKGFMCFLEALLIERLVPNIDRKLVNNKHRWVDAVGEGSLLIETAERPVINKDNYAGDMTVVGSQDYLDHFHSLIVLHEVEHEGKTKPEDVELKHQYHDTLNPEMWDDKTIKPEVRNKLMRSADAFVQFLKIEDLEPEDIILTGSNANYNWTQASDVDLHIVVDFNEVKARHGDLVDEYFNAKKNVFNNLHKIMIGSHEVEFYVQDSAEKHEASGVYSLMKDKWNVEPLHKEPAIDDSAVRAKTAEMMNAIDEVATECNQAAVVEALMEKLKKMRQSGLEEAGEFSTENLVFKTLRHNGYLEKLSLCKTKAFDRALSIEEEEWSELC